MSYQARLGVGDALPVSVGLEFVRETLRKTPAVLATSGIRGTRAHSVERTRQGPSRVAGEIVFQPSPSELDTLLRLITGSTKQADNSFPLTETLPETYVSIDRVARVFTYAGCKVSRARFRGKRGEMFELRIEFEGKTEAIAAAGSLPAVALDLGKPYVFSDATLQVDAVAYAFQEVEIVLDHHLDGSRWLNALDRASLPETDRRVLVRLATPFTSDETALLALGDTPKPVTVTFANGGYQLRFTFPAVQFPAESPTVSRAGEIGLLLPGVARKSGASLEVTITNDSTA
jgi:hypothetical protein